MNTENLTLLEEKQRFTFTSVFCELLHVKIRGLWYSLVAAESYLYSTHDFREIPQSV